MAMVEVVTMLFACLRCGFLTVKGVGSVECGVVWCKDEDGEMRCGMRW